MKKIVYCLILTLCLCAVNDAKADNVIDISGTYCGSFSTSLMSDYCSMELTQEEDYAKGTIKGNDGFEGKIKGRIKGNYWHFKIKEKGGCKGRFKGVGIIGYTDSFEDVIDIDMTFKGKDCLGKHEDGDGYFSQDNDCF